MLCIFGMTTLKVSLHLFYKSLTRKYKGSKSFHEDAIALLGKYLFVCCNTMAVYSKQNSFSDNAN